MLNQPPCTKKGTACIAEGDLKDARVELPPGFVGNPNATRRCTYQEFVHLELLQRSGGRGCATTLCRAKRCERNRRSLKSIPTSDPVYNLVPPPGVAAEFGFIVAAQYARVVADGGADGRGLWFDDERVGCQPGCAGGGEQGDDLGCAGEPGA